MTPTAAESALTAALARAQTDRTQDALTAVHMARRALRKAHEAARVDVMPDMDPLHAAIAYEARCRAAGEYGDDIRERRQREEGAAWQSRGFAGCPSCGNWKRRDTACACELTNGDAK